MPRLPFIFSVLAVAALVVLPLAAAAQSPELPSRAEAEAVCAFVAQDRWQLRDNTLSSGVFDVNNDGMAERVVAQKRGTMNNTVHELTSLDGTSVRRKPVGFNPVAFAKHHGAWLPYDGRTYYVAATDDEGRYRVYLSYVTPANEEYLLCAFGYRTKALLMPQSASDLELCGKVGRGEVTFLPVEQVDALAGVDGRGETTLEGRIRVDFDNDGEPEELSRLVYASGAGRGCGSEYYDLVDAAGAPTATMDQQAMLLQLQGVNLANRHPGPVCSGNRARWFQHNGLVHLDNRHRGAQPRGAQSEFHQVSVVEDGQRRLLCKGFFTVTHEITGYNDAL